MSLSTAVWIELLLAVRWHPPRLPGLSLPRNMIKLFGFTSKQRNLSSISAGLVVHIQIKLNSNGKQMHQKLSRELRGSRCSWRNLLPVQTHSHHRCVWRQLPSTIFRHVRPWNNFVSLSSILVVEEQLYVLKKGGFVNGLSFPLWDDPVQSSSISPYTWALWFISNPCFLTMALQWPRWSTQTFTRPTKKFMRLETPNSKARSVYAAPTNFTSRHSTTHRYWLFGLCVDFSLPWTFSKIWIDCKSKRLCSIAMAFNFSQLAVSSLSTTQVDGRYDLRVLFNGAYRRVGSFFFYRRSRWCQIFLDR